MDTSNVATIKGRDNLSLSIALKSNAMKSLKDIVWENEMQKWLELKFLKFRATKIFGDRNGVG
jgi:hypothetical protein